MKRMKRMKRMDRMKRMKPGGSFEVSFTEGAKPDWGDPFYPIHPFHPCSQGFL